MQVLLSLESLVMEVLMVLYTACIQAWGKLCSHVTFFKQIVDLLQSKILNVSQSTFPSHHCGAPSCAHLWLTVWNSVLLKNAGCFVLYGAWALSILPLHLKIPLCRNRLNKASRLGSFQASRLGSFSGEANSDSFTQRSSALITSSAVNSVLCSTVAPFALKRLVNVII